MIPTIEDIVAELICAWMSVEEAIRWINQHITLAVDGRDKAELRELPPEVVGALRTFAAHNWR